jgi:hypothetical protein
VKLPTYIIERLRGHISLVPDRGEHEQSLFREPFFKYIQAYRREGNAAAIEYRDKSKPVRPGEEVPSLLDAKPSLAI